MCQTTGRSGLVVVRLPAAGDVPGLNPQCRQVSMFINKITLRLRYAIVVDRVTTNDGITVGVWYH